MKQFWMVLKGSGGGGAHVRHETREIAEGEAKRLAAKERTEFYVLEAVAVAAPQDSPVLLLDLNGDAK